MKEADQLISDSPVMASITAAKRVFAQGLGIPICQCGLIREGGVYTIDQTAIKVAFQIAKSTVFQHEGKKRSRKTYFNVGA